MDEFKVPGAPVTPIYKCQEPIILVEKPAEPPPLPPPKTNPSVSCPYTVPQWSRPPCEYEFYRFEVLKSGQIIDEVKDLQHQAIWTFGRLPENDIAMAHPTISRFHAVLQYKPKHTFYEDIDEEEANSDNMPTPEQPEGWYIYDLGSTHGTFLNKQRLPPRVYIRIRVGHMLKLGSSTRVFILQGPRDDEEPESELSVTELREQREQAVALAAAEKIRKTFEAEERERNEGANWGMSEDADEETDLSHNPFASTNNEDLFFDDPKRTLRGFFEREGLTLEYKCDELSQGSFVCRVELPIDDSNGRPIVVEVTHKGKKKKDCVVQCALEACRTLDRHGVLRQANQESQKRKHVKAGNSDDEDEFLDRTGDVERKKQRKATSSASVTLTYDDLLKQEFELNLEQLKVEREIAAYQKNDKRLKELAVRQQTSDDLDNFMDTLSANIPQVDKTEIKKLRLEEHRIKSEQQRLERLIRLAKPTAFSFSSSTGAMNSTRSQDGSASKKQLPMIGKRNQFSKFKVVKPLPSTRPKVQTNVFASDDEEVEEEEEEVTTATTTTTTKLPTETVTKPSTNEDLAKIKPTAKSEVVTNKSLAAPEVANKSNVAHTIESTAEVPTATAVEESTDTTKSTDTTTLADAEEQSAEEEAAAHKKRRQRARQRNNKQRQDVDMDLNELAEHEDVEKYAKWVPPADQRGDGFTHLNDKFGY